jgi:hypothetical protein
MVTHQLRRTKVCNIEWVVQANRTLDEHRGIGMGSVSDIYTV